MCLKDFTPAVLVLENGDVFFGNSYAKTGTTYGELVFSTSMTGYQETLTDPSYYGQIVIQTAPHIGNTGINNEDYESKNIWVKGYVLRDASPISSSWRKDDSLQNGLINNSIVAITNLDTRELTKILRSSGAMKAGIFSGNDLLELTKCNKDEFLEYTFGEKINNPKFLGLIQLVKDSVPIKDVHYVPNVSAKQKYIIHAKDNAKYKVAALDLGIKSMTPHLMSLRNVEVHVFPYNATFEEIMSINPDGVFFSNGPGDPQAATTEVELLNNVLLKKIPFFGICMGNQMLGRALGFDTYKLKFGHRGINQPVMDLETKKVEITAHNHGFAVDIPLNQEVEARANKEFGRVVVSHIGLNDNVVEGIKCLDIPAFSVQYHPEAAAGPHDASYLFDRFVSLMDRYSPNLK